MIYQKSWQQHRTRQIATTSHVDGSIAAPKSSKGESGIESDYDSISWCQSSNPSISTQGSSIYLSRDAASKTNSGEGEDDE